MTAKKHAKQYAAFAVALVFGQLSVSTRATAQVIPGQNHEPIKEVIDFYKDMCARDPRKDAVGGFRMSDNVTYEIVIDEFGKTATVLYTDFTCGNLGPIWCGTGGCDTYLFVDGMTFVWRVSYPPYTVKIPDRFGSSSRTAVLFPLHGTYCRVASGEPLYGTYPCYEVASWESEGHTFVTRSGLLTSFDPKGP